MRKIFILIPAILIALTSCEAEKEKVQATNTETVEIPGTYGADFQESTVINTTQLVAELQGVDSFEGQIMGNINEVCTKKGCWLTMDLPDGESMRVTFKDYGFFVPTNSQGFPILLEGVATRVVTDVETLRHYAEDEGKSAEEVAKITEPRTEITFEATGVIIKDRA